MKFLFDVLAAFVPYAAGLWMGRRLSDAKWKREIGKVVAAACAAFIEQPDDAQHAGPCTCLGCAAGLPWPSMVGRRRQTVDEYVEGLSPEQFARLAALDDLPGRHAELRRAVALRAGKSKMVN